MKKRYMIIFGTRPEAIKMAPVITALKQMPEAEVCVCVTGQHRQMLDQVLSLFKIKPDMDFNLMQVDQTLNSITSGVLHNLQKSIKLWSPDMVFVHGDTTTSFASALAAFYERVPVAHVEAGLRTGNMHSPWPEELNRKVIGSLATVHFAPTQSAAQNLSLEGIKTSQIIITGNTVIDALLKARQIIEEDTELKYSLDKQFSYLDPKKKLVLITGHRRENLGQGFEDICSAISELSQREDAEFIYPVHLNPLVQEPVRRILGNKKNVHLIEPLEYITFVYLMSRAYMILTDSGGVQEEAPSLGKPVLVTRNTTERPEAVSAGSVKIVGTDRYKIFNETRRILDDVDEHFKMSRVQNPYGDGFASQRICDYLMRV